MGNLVEFEIAGNAGCKALVFMPKSCNWVTLTDMIGVRLNISKEYKITEVRVMDKESGNEFATWCDGQTILAPDSALVRCYVYLAGDSSGNVGVSPLPSSKIPPIADVSEVQKISVIERKQCRHSDMTSTTLVNEKSAELEGTKPRSVSEAPQPGQPTFPAKNEFVPFMSIVSKEAPSPRPLTDLPSSIFIDLCLNGSASSVLSALTSTAAFVPDRDQAEGMITACAHGHVAVAQALEDCGVDVEVQGASAEMTPLHHAALRNQSTVCSWLLNRGACPTRMNTWGTCALHYFCINGMADMLSSLETIDWDVRSAGGRTGLHFAAGFGHTSTVSALLAHKVQMEAKDEYGSTPLHYAAEMGMTEAARLLLKALVASGKGVDAQNNQGATPLQVACRGGHVEIARLLWHDGANVFHEDSQWNGSMHYASIGGSLPVVKWLLEDMGHSPCTTNKDNLTPVELAKKGAHMELVDYLSSHVAHEFRSETCVTTATDPMHVKISGAPCTPDASASRHSLNSPNPTKHDRPSNEKDAAAAGSPPAGGSGSGSAHSNDGDLHRHRADKETLPVDEEKWIVPSDNSAGRPCNESLVVPLEDGMCVESHVSRDYTVTPYLTACAQGDLKHVQLFIDGGGSVSACNEKGSQGIHFAASGGHLSVVKYMVDRGVPLDTSNCSGSSALHFACQHCHMQVIKWLVSKGADTTLCNTGLMTPIHLLCVNGDVAVPIFQWFADTHLDLRYFKDGASSEERYRYTIMPALSLLHCACMGEGVRLVEAVIDAGVSVHDRSGEGKTALHISAEKSNFEAVKLICECSSGYDVINAVDDEGKSAIFDTCLAGSIQAAKYLHGLGADISIPNLRGSTCLHAACQSGNIRLVQWLVNVGADINAANSAGFRPADFAWKCKDDVVMSFLRSMQALDHLIVQDIRVACLSNAIQKLHDIVREGYDLLSAVVFISPLTGDSSIFHEVCRNGLLDVVQYIYDTCKNPLTELDHLGYSPLHYAAMQGHSPVVMWLVAREVGPLQLTSGGRTSMHIAARYGHRDIVHFFAQRGVNVDCRSPTGMTPLSDACTWGMLDVVKYLVEKGADTAAVDIDNRTIVHCACEAGSVELIEYLLRKAVQIDEEDNNDITPFLLACQHGALSVCEVLLSHGCNLYQKGGAESKGDCALHFAARTGQLHIVKWLVGLGINPKTKNNNCDTAADVAALIGHHDVADWLNENESSFPENRMLHFLEPQLSWALENNFFKFARYTVAEIMLEITRPQEFERQDGSTLLHSAAAAGNAILVETLISGGCDVEKRARDGWSALHYACAKGHIEVVRVLRSFGAKMKARDLAGNTGLHVGADFGHTNIVRYFANSLKNLDIANSLGWTALHYAASRGNEAAVKALVERGASGNIKASGGVTALHVACRGQQQAVVDYLLRSGAANVAARDDEGLTAADVARQSGMPISDWQKEISRGSDINSLPDPIHANIDGNKTLQWTSLTAAAGVMLPPWPSVTSVTGMLLNPDESTLTATQTEPSMFSCLSTTASIPTSVEFASSHSDHRLETGATGDISAFSNDEVVLNECFVEAIENGDIAMANSLIIAGASPLFATPTSKNTALHTACAKGNVIAVKFLCDRGVNVNARNLGGLTPLHVAVDREFTEIALHLIREGAMLGTVNKTGQSALHIMASRGMTDAIRELALLPSRLIRTQDVNAKTNSNQTVLHLAVAAGHSELLEDLLRLDVAVDATDNDGQTSLHLACALSNYQACKLLLSKGADPNKCDNAGKSALYFACVSGNIKLVQALVDHDGIIHSRTKTGDSLLHASCHHGSLLISKWLVSRGLDLSLKNHSRQSPAMYALDSTDPAMVEWIRGKGTFS